MGNDLWAAHSSPSERAAALLLLCYLSPPRCTGMLKQNKSCKLRQHDFSYYVPTSDSCCSAILENALSEPKRIFLTALYSLVHRRKMMIRRLPSIYHRGRGEDVGFGPLSLSLPLCLLESCGRRNSAELEFHAEKRKSFGSSLVVL